MKEMQYWQEKVSNILALNYTSVNELFIFLAADYVVTLFVLIG